MMLQDKVNRVIEICGGWGLYEAGASTAQKQMIKAGSEWGELCDHIASEDKDKIMDDIGDILVCFINAKKIYGEAEDSLPEFTPTSHSDSYAVGYIGQNIAHSITNMSLLYESYFLGLLAGLSEYYELTLEQCLDQAISEIEKRKGKIVNGVFIKDMRV